MIYNLIKLTNEKLFIDCHSFSKFYFIEIVTNINSNDISNFLDTFTERPRQNFIQDVNNIYRKFKC